MVAQIVCICAIDVCNDYCEGKYKSSDVIENSYYSEKMLRVHHKKREASTTSPFKRFAVSKNYLRKPRALTIAR